ncbi:MAG TPA: hypothetical protein VIN35_01090 [Hydrogenophaga sp.]
MKLSPSEKQTLVVPLAIGSLLGAFVAYGVFAFNGEYRLQNGESVDKWQTAAEATFAFLVALSTTVSLLGVLPILVQRWHEKGGDDV